MAQDLFPAENSASTSLAPFWRCHRSRCKSAAGLVGGEVAKVVLGRGYFWETALLLLLRFCLVNCFARLLAALAWLAALVPFPVWVLRLNRIPRLLSVWFIASRGHHFALGTGGLKLSLLVGGLGPVYSLPKYCFKPFRRLSAVGFVLGWHREPLFNNNPAGTVGFCRYHGGNH